MGTVAGPGTLKAGRNADLLAHLEEREGVQQPGAFVEVTGEEPAAIPVDQRVYAGDHVAREVSVDDRVVQRCVAA
jgi:hypothetical protein